MDASIDRGARRFSIFLCVFSAAQSFTARRTPSGSALKSTSSNRPANCPSIVFLNVGK